jgi:hypothetical protein
MTVENVYRCLALVAANWPGYVVTDERKALWCAELAGVGDRSGVEAFRRHVRTAKFEPRVADILELVATMESGETTGIEEWRAVVEAAGKFGRTRPPGFAHPVTQRMVDAVGWLEICNTPEGPELLAIQRRFVDGWNGAIIGYRRSKIAAVAERAPVDRQLDGAPAVAILPDPAKRRKP